MTDHKLRDVTAREAVIAFLDNKISHMTFDDGALRRISGVTIGENLTFTSGVLIDVRKADEEVTVRITDGPHATVSIGGLSAAEQRAARTILGKIPAVLLPSGGMGYATRPQTVQELLSIIQAIGEGGHNYMNEAEKFRDQIAADQRDMDAVGRVLARILPKVAE